ncbi:MAG: zeta toxin family protein [Methylococcales bacterium]|nr:zeta toxin family protein [Methylococcales bacterium]
MYKNNFPKSSEFEYLTKLRTALAISQGTKLFATLRQEAEATVSHDQSKRVTYLTELFSRIHREIFHDWQDQATVDHRPGTINKGVKRKAFRLTVEQLVLESDCNNDTAIFDNNGFVIYSEDIAERLAGFYQKMRQVRPFSYGNRITLDFFMTALGKLPAFKSVYEQGIDFRRLDAVDTSALHDLESDLVFVTTAFKHALDPSQIKILQNEANAYGEWPENKVFISGVPFLSHTTEQGTFCLVLVNGGLVPLETIKDRIFVEGKQFADNPVDATRHIIGYLPETESLRVKEKTEIDGISIRSGETPPLFCLDVNVLTSLRSPSHTELLELIKQCEGNDKYLIFTLANNQELKTKLLNAAKGDERLVRSVEIAYTRLSKISKKLDQALESIFTGKTSVSNPMLFMSMGGAGAGKTAVEEIAEAHCGDNYVIASLDEFRKISDLYTVLTAANHHSDDYNYVEPFANRLRQMVADHARKMRINILYDGTSIPYQPRYYNIVEQFKASGFKTQITAVDAFIVKPKGRESELMRSDVISSVKSRYEQTKRALPWVVTVDKHIRAPLQFLKALEHQALEKISLFANDGDKDKHYLVAESFTFTDLEVYSLQQHQLSGTLLDYVTWLIKNHDESVLKNLSGSNLPSIEALIKRNPLFIETNVSYLIYNSLYGNCVLIIYNVRRMVDFIEKRQLNPNASGVAGLLHKPESLAFDVDPLAEHPWIKRLQGSLVN